MWRRTIDEDYDVENWIINDGILKMEENIIILIFIIMITIKN